MKREIKFRAWDGKQMRFPNLIDVIDLTCYNRDGITPGYFFAESLMQFTGLPDKNGREIYESDIVKFQWGGSYTIREVIYQNCAFSVQLPEPHEKLIVQIGHSSGDIEIIGNIYESPELLTTNTEKK